MRDKTWFKNIFIENDFSIDDNKLSLLEKYCDLLISKNQVVNLISPNSEKNIWEEHILHSLSFLLKVKLKQKSYILDLGTGGGLPGIPLKILFPDIKMVLIDSTQKKMIAVKEIINSLGITGIEIFTGRAEELKSENKLNSKFDYVISRAVGKLDKILEWGLPFLKKSSTKTNDNIPTRSILVLKGGNITDELNIVKKNKKLFNLDVINITFKGCENLFNPDKKLIIMYPK